MRVNVQGLSHVTCETTDLDRMIDYYTDVIGLVLAGREKNRAYLQTVFGEPAVTLKGGARARLTGVSWFVPADTNFANAAETFRNDFGLKPEMRNDSEPHASSLLSFIDVNDTRVDLITSQKRAPRDNTPRDFVALRMAHAAIMTPNFDQSVKFYTEGLGFKVADWRGDFFVWMRCSPNHHDFDFVRHGEVKMHHFAFELKDASEIFRACDSLARKKTKIIYGPMRHVIGDNISTYHRNPDGQIVELYTEMARVENEATGTFSPRLSQPEETYAPKVWPSDTAGNVWGRGAPEGFALGSE
jgi:catechol 2,3-dioxygenase-like lactoylglutathione lyase family enzyme